MPSLWLFAVLCYAQVVRWCALCKAPELEDALFLVIEHTNLSPRGNATWVHPSVANGTVLLLEVVPASPASTERPAAAHATLRSDEVAFSSASTPRAVRNVVSGPAKPRTASVQLQLAVRAD